jgi:tetratricopeptide (TPR) repeat protein
MPTDPAPDAEVVRLAAIVDEHRRLLAESPGSLFPVYADSLMTLGACLAELGRGDEALAAALEGVAHFQALAVGEPGTFGVHLASALNNLSNRLQEAGRDADARRAGGEAVALARAALAERPEQARFVLVSALMNQAGRAWRDGAAVAALADMEAATVAFRDGGESMATYLGVMVEALHRNAMALGEAGLWTEAVAVRRMTGLCFPGGQPSPVGHLLALTLEQAAHALSAAGRAGEGLPLIEEALEIARRLAAEDPTQYRLFLGQTLGNLASRQYEAGAHAEAMEAALEAIGLFQQVAETDAASAVLPLSVTLETFAAILAALGQPDQAAIVLTQRDTLVKVMEEARAYAESRDDGED